MKKIYLILSLILITTSGISQDLLENESSGLTTKKRFSLSAISFPKGMNGEEYRQFGLSYPISQKLTAQVGGIYDKNISSELINSSFMFKWYVKEKLYLFAGLENVYETNIFTDGQYIIRTNFNFGVGYDVNPNFLLELGYHQQINQPNEQYFENEKKEKGFSLRAKF